LPNQLLPKSNVRTPLPRPHFWIAVPLSLLFLLSGCNSQSSDSIGEAYVAPATLNLRHDLAGKKGTIAVLKHGEHLDIVDVRRRFVKVRTAKGAEGWVDSSQLLSTEQMEQIRHDDKIYQALPSEGAASAYETTNVHIEPSRISPPFTSIAASGVVATLAHRLSPKATGPAPPNSLALVRVQTVPRRQRREKAARNSMRLPPKPPPPKPPANWQELSAERIDGAESIADAHAEAEHQQAEKRAESAKKPPVLEDWTLVRTKDGQCGWVLSRNLMMAIPDEVAQYAEGKHITSYFDLGQVTDEDKGVKHNWLWTTASSQEPYDFDSWRVFLWSRRHHRYETSYRQHDIEGYFPVHAEPAGSGGASATFQLITKDDDGKFYRRTYVFDGTRVHLTGQEPYQPGAANKSRASGLNMAQIHSKLPQPSWLRRQWNGLLRRIRGK
jgi:SH3-like domain-containing protein